MDPTVLLPTAMAFLGASGAGHVGAINKPNDREVCLRLLRIENNITNNKKSAKRVHATRTHFKVLFSEYNSFDNYLCAASR